MDDYVIPHCRACGEQGVAIAFDHIDEDILFWQCTKCENRWHHHTTGRLRDIADPYVQRGKERARVPQDR
jgi:hypothetical protein